LKIISKDYPEIEGKKENKMIKQTIFALLILLFFNPFFAYSMSKEEFNELYLSEKVELLLEEGYRAYKSRKLHTSFKFLTKLGEVIYDEIKLSDREFRKRLKNCGDDVFNFAVLIDDGVNFSKDDYYDMAWKTRNILLTHCNRRAILFKKKGYKSGYKEAKYEVKAMRSLREKWNRNPKKIVRDEEKFVNLFANLGKNIIEGVGKGFKNFGDNIDHSLHVGSSLKRMEEKYEEESEWQK